ncbi:WXG100 family type VII secretion target [Streptomyces sp. NPDC051684]|uniref:WXG100 family type VII secretion target n=1 Tax=Streptomyces sp. NPDC051684 TaxID=3365670 RepID=UPI003799593F
MAGFGSGSFDVDPAVLKEQAGSFGELGKSFKAAAKELKDALESAEEGWGEDIIGTFNDIYEPVREGMATSMEHLADELGKIGGNLKVMATQYEVTEDDQAQIMIGQQSSRPGLGMQF